jgi:anionic cell wall polymer biosynthesis LytR-Cps2A-Psr (LCP) family protein
VVVAPRPSRRQTRVERRRRLRRRFGAGTIVALVAVAAGAAAAAYYGTGGGHGSTHVAADKQQTLFLALQGADGDATVSMLVAHDSTSDQGLEVLVPSRLITDVCGFGSQQFGNIVSLPNGAVLAAGALSQVLGGVKVDRSLVLTTTELARLVDTAGGVVVDVDVDVVQQQTGSGGLVVVPKGNNERLDGTRAVEFATYVAPGEDPTADLVRFQSVFDALLAALPTKTAQAAKVLTAGGVGSDAPAAAALLTGLAADNKANRVLPIDLPTQTIDSGGGAPSYRIDSAKTSQLVHSQLANSLPAKTGQAPETVLIENGAGTPGLVLSACNRLLPAGFGFAGSGNAPNFNYRTSQVIVFDSSVGTAKVGDRVAQLLGLPQSDVVASAQGQNVADVIVILGHDYRP